MKVLSSASVIHVSNLQSAIKYYTDNLGFTVDFIFGDYAGLRYDEVCIHLNGPKIQALRSCRAAPMYVSIAMKWTHIITLYLQNKH